jgi:hypothetical protein
MSNAAIETQREEMPEDPQAWREEFRRRLAERGIHIRVGKIDPEWTFPEPLPIDADEMSRFVVQLRREGKL